MKKLLLSSLVATSIFAFAYTQVDVDNANYLANKNIITQQSTATGYRLDATITRAEVAGIALKVKWMVLPSYQCKWYFSDLINNDWRCRAAELAADAGIVSRTNATFRPQDNITKAEALAIIMKAWNINAPSWATVAVFPYSDVLVGWQSDIILYAAGIWIVKNPNIIPLSEGFQIVENVVPIKFYPNQNATRAEVFGFAKNILEYKATMSGEVTL
jgi:hypothetical protein